MSSKASMVQEFFATLERGNLTGVLDFLEEEVDWQSPVTRSHPPELPWCAVRHTKLEVAAFFRELGERVQPQGFELIKIYAHDDWVAVEGKNRGTVRRMGRTYEHEWAMFFWIRDDKIVRFRHYYDTGDLLEAFRGD